MRRNIFIAFLFAVSPIGGLFSPFALVHADPEPQAFSDSESAILEVLKKFETISIAFTEAPGNGHFASTRLIMDRLRALGYQGHFDIYIDPKIKNQVKIFLPGYNPDGKGVQNLPDLNASTRSLDMSRRLEWRVGFSESVSEFVPEYGAAKVKKFAIMGGDDSRLPPRQIGADALLVVQPSGWSTPELRVTRSGHWGEKGFYQSLHFHDERSLKIREVPSETKMTPNLIHSEMNSVEGFGYKAEGLVRLSSVLGEHEVMTAYGLGFRNGPRKLVSVVTAAVQMQQSSAVPLKQGTIVPLISNFNADEWLEFHRNLPFEVRPRIKILPIDDPGLVSSASLLKKDEILIVKTGGVTQKIWNYLMRQSSFPPLASGTTGSAYLAGLGRPYINTVGGKASTTELTLPFIKSIADDVEMNRFERVRVFFAAARDDKSDLRKAFGAQGEALASGPDKLATVFEKMHASDCIRELLGSFEPVTKPAPGIEGFAELASELSP